MRARDVFAALALAAGACVSAGADEPLFRHRAPIVVEQSAAFVRLPLTPAVYANSARSDLHDLRIVDAEKRTGSVRAARAAPRRTRVGGATARRHALSVAGPPRRPGGMAVADRSDGRRGPHHGAAASDGRRRRPARGASPGWLVDLGARPRDEAPPQALRLQWSGPAEFSATYAIELSDDLRQWRSGGAGQLMALASPAGALTQPTVPLPAAPGRFVRLVWSDAAAAPVLVGAQAVRTTQRRVALDAPVELVVDAGPAPATSAGADDSKRALHFDLGAPLPLVQLDLRLAGATQVVPARLQVRERLDEAWQPLAGAVFYRLEREGEPATSPPLTVRRTARYVRVVPDERAARPDAATTRLVVRAELGSLVFAAQGRPPYVLQAGARDAPAGALPIATLVPSLADERARFGRASLGAWSEVTEAMRQAEAEQRRAALRPWALWAVLGLGVAGLAVMVWRLARGGAARPPVG